MCCLEVRKRAEVVRSIGTTDALQARDHFFVRTHDVVVGWQAKKEPLLQKVDVHRPFADLSRLIIARSRGVPRHPKVHCAGSEEYGRLVDQGPHVATASGGLISLELLLIGAAGCPCSDSRTNYT